MKFLVIGDLHGQLPRVPDVEFDAIIAPGDVCSDQGIKPLMLEAVKARSEGEEVHDWWDVVSREKAEKLVNESVAAGRAVFEKLNSYGVPVFAIPGNWDWTGYEDVSWELLTKNLFEEEVIAGFENVINCEDALVELENLSLIGYGRVNGPELVELRGYADVDEEELRESKEHYQDLFAFYSELFRQATTPTILLAHNVPYGTSIDVIVDEGNPMDGMHYGSNVVRALIEEFSPLASIGGHIHEHYGVDEINGTKCLNAGFGADKATLVEVTAEGVRVELIQ